MLWVGGLGHEGDCGIREVEVLHCGILSVYQSHGNLTLFHLLLAADDDDIPIVDAQGIHAVPAHPQAKVFRAAVQVGEGGGLLSFSLGGLEPQGYRDAQTAAEAAKKAAKVCTAWCIDGTLREFPKISPVNLWFDFPVHRNDESGVLVDIDTGGAAIPEGPEGQGEPGGAARGNVSAKNTRWQSGTSASLTTIFTPLQRNFLRK